MPLDPAGIPEPSEEGPDRWEVPAVGYHHQIRVRYGEVDMQGVVFNAHYLAYVDDAMSAWMREVGFGYPSAALGFDFMVVRAELDWGGSASFDELLEIHSQVERWGTKSFTVAHRLHVGDRKIALVRVVYVGIRLGTKDTVEIPTAFREVLSALPG